MSRQKRTAVRLRLQKLLEEVRRLKTISTSAERDWRKLQVEVLDDLDSLSIESFSYESDEGEQVKATKVQSSTLIFDEAQLKKALGAKVWNKVTRRVLDTTMLEDAIAEGRVDPVTVAECSSEKMSKPYIKVTVKNSESKTPRSPTANKVGRKPTANRVGRKRGIPRS